MRTSRLGVAAAMLAAPATAADGCPAGLAMIDLRL
jgi:hypothetical protein